VTKVAISQSNYIPWKGYFDMIAYADHFVLYDDVQFTRRDWRNRNKIKTPQGTTWLTVPVRSKGSYDQPINTIEVDGPFWAQKHWKTISSNYTNAACFQDLKALLKPLYSRSSHTMLSELNAEFIQVICEYLAIQTPIHDSRVFALAKGQSERLLGICKDLQATSYVSGPAAKSYLDEALFAAEGIQVEWFDYSGYPEYAQLWGEFEHGVSVIDLIANTGPGATRYMKHV
jgi:hypothetical protein